MANALRTRAIELWVENNNWDYWTSVNVALSMETLSGSFDLDISFDSDDQHPWPIPKGAACTLSAYGYPVIVGYTDSVAPHYSKTDCGLTVGGRDSAADLVDCAAVHKSGEWRTVKV